MGDEHRRMIAQSPMDITLATPLLGGLTPRVFMRRHWQKKPLVVRQALPGGVVLASRQALFELARHDEVESRLVTRQGATWRLRQGPLPRSAIPPLKQREWTLLLQGLDLHLPSARALLDRFRFVPDARVDDLMLSYASDGGGVGPHIDSYDVFLLQAQGRRRWRFGRLRAAQMVADAPLKLLANFDGGDEVLLEAGDMLYLPPGWAHDGVAEGECVTCSIGFRAAGRDEIAREVLQRVIDAADAQAAGPLYRDPAQPAVAQPGRIPAELQAFAARSVARLLDDADGLACALGEVLSEPKRGVWFDAPQRGDADADGASDASAGVRLDQRTRVLYDARRLFINGESYVAAGRDARLMQHLADHRLLSAAEVAALSSDARGLVDDWLANGWLQAVSTTDPGGI
jgi:50S ribosomal protein L16 3-hydroxylase